MWFALKKKLIQFWYEPEAVYTSEPDEKERMKKDSVVYEPFYSVTCAYFFELWSVM